MEVLQEEALLRQRDVQTDSLLLTGLQKQIRPLIQESNSHNHIISTAQVNTQFKTVFYLHHTPDKAIYHHFDNFIKLYQVLTLWFGRRNNMTLLICIFIIRKGSFLLCSCYVHRSIHLLYPPNPIQGHAGWNLSQQPLHERQGKPWTGCQSILDMLFTQWTTKYFTFLIH